MKPLKLFSSAATPADAALDAGLISSQHPHVLRYAALALIVALGCGDHAASQAAAALPAATALVQTSAVAGQEPGVESPGSRADAPAGAVLVSAIRYNPNTPPQDARDLSGARPVRPVPGLASTKANAKRRADVREGARP